MSANHGCRMFTHTVMTNAKINIEIREMTLGHSIGLRCILHANTRAIPNAYLKVVEELTINKENRLAKQVHELKTKKEGSK